VRTNGTGLQTNRTHIAHAYAGGDAAAAAANLKLNWRVFAAEHTYDQVFSAINATRTVDTLNRVQRVPARSEGTSANISAVLGDHTLLGGLELRRVRGASDEVAFANGNPTSVTGTGGRQFTTGIFAQDFIRIGDRAVISGTARYDRWVNDQGSLATRTLSSNAVAVRSLPRRVEDAFSPQISALYHVSDAFSLYANLSRSFRSPTLNELYRAFRVGNVVTNANENLRAEQAVNFEGGVRYSFRRLSMRASGFMTKIDEPISNVTLSVTPTLITRQRQNAGATRSAGLEIESELRVSRLQLLAGYQFADSVVTDFPSNPGIVGLLIPQVARHQFTFQARVGGRRWTAAVQGRASSQQFDDDLNQLRLEPYAQIDVYASRKVHERVEIYAAVENVFNSRYSIGRTPVRTVSSPINGRIGIRFR
jgi:outer membrane receptor protein involved in Fe transport